jgi:hypothetical protein
MNDLPEPLEEFLKFPPIMPPDLEKKELIAKSSASMLPRARGRLYTPTVIAASMALGSLATYFIMNITRDPPYQSVTQMRARVRDETDPKKTMPQKNEQKPRDAHGLEWAAFDAATDAERAKLYFQAGDLFLDQYADCESAVRCYSQAIRCCSPQERQVTRNDNWLVVAIKSDFPKE